MKTNIIISSLAALAWLANLNTALAQGTAFTYQGRLSAGDTLANGLYEMSFALCDALTNGNVVGTPVTLAPVPVSNGLFTATLDFGATAFTGAGRWLEIAVTVFGSDQPVVTLVPRQPITPTPYALHAANAAGLMSFANAPLDIKVNGERILRLEATGSGPNVVGGASVNSVAPGVIGATISGGGTSSPGFEATNRVEANYGTISGGAAHTIQLSSRNSTIGGGNSSTAEGASVSGGVNNSSGAIYATVSGGAGNSASEAYATIGGGLGNIGSNAFSMVVGGYLNIAGGICSLAAGQGAHALGGWFFRVG